MRVNWIRDEVILALDVLFLTDGKGLSMDNPAIIELSELLNRLPIVPLNKRSEFFRNVAGVRRQIVTFEWSIKKSIEHPHVGKIFYEVYDEFKNNKTTLHRIAQAIRRCDMISKKLLFDDERNIDDFYEGTLLARLHRVLEKSNKIGCQDNKCYVCKLKPQHIYKEINFAYFLQRHLLIPPENYGNDIKPEEKDFITVCPNCHFVLHQTRPWMTIENVSMILKTI